MKLIALLVGLSLQDSAEHARLASVKAEPAAVERGGVVRLRFEIAIDTDFHIYPTRKQQFTQETSFEFEGPLAVAGEIVNPPTTRHVEKGPDGKVLFEYDQVEGTAVFVVPVRVNAAPGALTIRGKVKGQTCDPRSCSDLELPFEVAVTVAPATRDGGRQENGGEQEKGLIGWIIAAIIGGLVSLVQPCVFPLLPITLTYFLKQSEGSRARGLALSSLYGLGIVATFTAIGIIFAVALGAAGPRIFAANPWVNIGVAGLFLWFTFSLFGLYDISLPSWLVGGLTAGGPKKGYSGAFVLGLLFAVVTFTCTIPIAAAILGLVATAGSRTTGVVAMFAYSLTMAAPFLVMGVFPSLIKAVQRGGGGWLHTVKVTMGFVELGLALYYLSKADLVWEFGVLTRPVMLAVYVGVLSLTGLYLLGVFRMKGDPEPVPPEPGAPPAPPSVGVARMLLALTFAILAVYVGSGFTGRELGFFDTVLPPRPGQEGGLDAALAEAKKTGKPVFLEFTGVT